MDSAMRLDRASFGFLSVSVMSLRPGGSGARQLTKREREQTLHLFDEYAKGSKTIEVMDVLDALKTRGHHLTLTEVQNELSGVGWISGPVDYSKFEQLTEQEILSRLKYNPQTDEEFIAAFVGLGGNPDATGKVNLGRMLEVLQQFGLRVSRIKEDIEALGLTEQVEYVQFKHLMW